MKKLMNDLLIAQSVEYDAMGEFAIEFIKKKSYSTLTTRLFLVHPDWNPFIQSSWRTCFVIKFYTRYKDSLLIDKRLKKNFELLSKARKDHNITNDVGCSCAGGVDICVWDTFPWVTSMPSAGEFIEMSMFYFEKIITLVGILYGMTKERKDLFNESEGAALMNNNELSLISMTQDIIKIVIKIQENHPELITERLQEVLAGIKVTRFSKSEHAQA